MKLEQMGLRPELPMIWDSLSPSPPSRDRALYIGSFDVWARLLP